MGRKEVIAGGAPDRSLIMQWREWAGREYPDERVAYGLGTLAAGITALGCGDQASIVDSVRSVAALEPPLALADDGEATEQVAYVLRHYLDRGWSPPPQPSGNAILKPGEAIYSSGGHERSVYTGGNVQYRRGGMVAFGSPLLVGASLLGSAAFSGASKARAQKKAAVQWRFGGRGRAMFSNQRLLLVEDKLISIPYDGLQAINVEDEELHIILQSGTPIMLRLGEAASAHGTLVDWFCRQAPAPPALTAASPPAPVAAQFSPDRRHWWDGQQWVDATLRIPAGALLSPDGSQWHDGEAWRALPQPPS